MIVVLEIERKLVVVIVLKGNNTDVVVVVVVVDGNNKNVALVVMVVGGIIRNVVVVVVEDGNNRNVVALAVAVVVEEGSNRNVLIALAVEEETIDVHFMAMVSWCWLRKAIEIWWWLSWER